MRAGFQGRDSTEVVWPVSEEPGLKARDGVDQTFGSYSGRVLACADSCCPL